MALMAGVEAHKAFLSKMGQLTRLRTELPESAEPLVPKKLGRTQYDDDCLRAGP